jgi:PIN domain nuclease of toxin-antitoxin system
VNLLLDSHTFLWFCQDHPSLSAAARALLEDPANSPAATCAGTTSNATICAFSTASWMLRAELFDDTKDIVRQALGQAC